MQRILPLAKKSAKEVFLKLREQWPYFCSELKNSVFIWRAFFNHITFSSKKNRETRELLERFLVIPFIEKIIKNWEVNEERVWEKWERYFKVSVKDWKDIFSVIIIKSKKKYFLLSCFVNFKKNLS